MKFNRLCLRLWRKKPISSLSLPPILIEYPIGCSPLLQKLFRCWLNLEPAQINPAPIKADLHRNCPSAFEPDRNFRFCFWGLLELFLHDHIITTYEIHKRSCELRVVCLHPIYTLLLLDTCQFAHVAVAFQ